MDADSPHSLKIRAMSRAQDTAENGRYCNQRLSKGGGGEGKRGKRGDSPASQGLKGKEGGRMREGVGGSL